MKIYPDMIQGSDDWFDKRLGMVTSSNFDKATSKGRGKAASLTRLKYMRKLVGERDRQIVQESFSSRSMVRGSGTEQQACEYYEFVNSCTVQHVGFVERDDDVGCSPDGLVGDDGLVEIKCPDPHTHIGYIQDDKVPDAYIDQIQGQLWVTDRKWCDFVSFDPHMSKRKIFVKKVYRDEKYITELHINIVMFVTELKEMLEKLNHCPF